MITDAKASTSDKEGGGLLYWWCCNEEIPLSRGGGEGGSPVLRAGLRPGGGGEAGCKCEGRWPLVATGAALAGHSKLQRSCS